MNKSQIEEFFLKNYDRNRKWKPMCALEESKSFVIVCNGKQISSIEIKQILTDIQHTIRARGILGQIDTIYINIPSFNPNDKLVYILLECIVYSLISIYGYNGQLRINEFIGNINTQGFLHTALGEMVQRNLSRDEFYKEHWFSIDKFHYRRIVKSDEDMMSTSNMLSEIKTFLCRFSMPEEFKSTFAKIITELVDNACEHAKADCLVDIDVTEPDYICTIPELEETNFYGINVVVLNFSDKCLGDEIKEKIKNHYYKDSKRYDSVENAYVFHKTRFKKAYTEEDFFNITAFQEKISGRVNETKSGGTGLAELIKNLQEYAYEDYCYIMTGDKGLFFKKELLNYDENNWVGFNEDRNYLTNIPCKDALVRSHTYLPGTGYNFMFVFKEEA